jgi:hypothetical protein
LLRRLFSGFLVFIFALAPLSVLADPPAHAPAHGRRDKQQKAAPQSPESRPRNAIEVSFDSERGIYVGVNFTDVFFHEGRYYRERDGRWEVSLSGSGGWSFSASSSVPEVISRAKRTHPGPAAKAKRSKGRGK